MISRRTALPSPEQRLPLGASGLRVSPYCLGLVHDPETVIAAYEAGINFFFVTADLHWPIYAGLRAGLARLLEGNPRRRDEIVVGIVSYLDNPLFGCLQFQEVFGEVPGMDRADVAIAGAVSSEASFYSRLESLTRARQTAYHGIRAVGATFHDRKLAVAASYYAPLDISYIRYNTAHPGARTEIFPYLPARRSGLVFNFKSVLSRVTAESFRALGLPPSSWLPDAGDYYRFVLTRPELDGILLSPQTPDEVRALVEAIGKGPLSAGQEEYMIRLSQLAGAVVMA